MGIKLVPNTENCIISGNELLPTVGPDGHIIGILNPDVCYNTCDWVDINYPQLLINKESFNSQNSEINLTSNSANGVTIDCISANVCDLKIEFYDLKGTLVQIHEESFNNTMQRIDISKLIKSNGLFMYKVYINNKLVQNGKIIK